MKTSKMVNMFKSEGMYYIFNLLYTDGETRQNNLNMRRSLYQSKEEVQEWYNEIKNSLETPDFERVMKKLDELNNNTLKRIK